MQWQFTNTQFGFSIIICILILLFINLNIGLIQIFKLEVTCVIAIEEMDVLRKL